MYPFFVENTLPCARLYKLKDGRYQVVMTGNICPFLSGYDYLLAEREFAEYLQDLGLEQASFKDALIFDPVTKQEITTHVEIIITQHFKANDINDINLTGDKLLVMDHQYIFATPSLKDKLSNSKFSFLQFSEGLSHFA